MEIVPQNDDAFVMVDHESAYAYAKQVQADSLAEFEREISTYKQLENIPIDFFKKYRKDLDPAAMLYVLEQIPYCHAAAHTLGELIFEEKQQLIPSLETCSKLCTQGCVHGVMKGFVGDQSTFTADFIHVETTAIVEELKQQSHQACSERNDGSLSYQTECYHGIGHGLAMITGYDTNKAIELCEDIVDDPNLVHCISGVYMERDAVYGEQDTRLGYLYPCNRISEYHTACYRYKLRRSFALRDEPENSSLQEKAINECLMLEDDTHREACFFGLGDALAALGRVDMDAVVNICSRGSANERDQCLHTPIYNLAIEVYADAQTSCLNVNDQIIRETCLKIVDSSRGVY